MISIELPLRTQSENNVASRAGWRVRHTRAAGQRALVMNALRALVGPTCPLPLPLTVKLTRLAPRELDWDDNLPGSMKYIRDTIAKWLKVDDRKREIVSYEYDQQKVSKRYAVRIEIRAKGEK